MWPWTWILQYFDKAYHFTTKVAVLSALTKAFCLKQFLTKSSETSLYYCKQYKLEKS